MGVRRLFLFASYDKQGVIDDTVLHYLRCLSGYGDIVFVMDNIAPNAELNKLNDIPNVLYKLAERHGEYDFGSYKRGFQWAQKNKILSKYDWVYLVNDSVYGPLFDIKKILENLESSGADLVGMIDFKNKFTPVQVQSWFVGLSRKVANASFISNFMKNIRPQTDKQLIVLKYEVGLSQMILRRGYKMATFISGENGDLIHRVYDKPLELLKEGFEVHVVKNASSSRSEAEHNTGIELMKQYGAYITSVEIVLFELLKTSKHSNFKEIQNLIK